MKNFRIVDESGDFFGSIFIENGFIKEIFSGAVNLPDADIIVDSSGFAPSAVLMPAFIDLHAHFRDPGFPEKEFAFPSESVQSASLAAVSGGFTTVVCMANTKPAIDTFVKARALKDRSDALGLIDLYPVLSLSKNMEGRELSGIRDLLRADKESVYNLPLMLSEDGMDVVDDDLFYLAMREARRLGIPVSCHCDLGGEAYAVRRAIGIGKKAGCHVHIAHVSTGETVEIIRKAKKNAAAENGFILTCEATPHHIGATEADARRMGVESFGRVNPPLRSEVDRQAIITAIGDGTIDAVATDHAPHSEEDKAAGSPGFTGLETAFSACLTCLVSGNELCKISRLLSAAPAQILGLEDRGRVAQGLRADLVIVDTHATWRVEPERFKSRGKCSPFTGRELTGKVLMTFNAGRIVFWEDRIA